MKVVRVNNNIHELAVDKAKELGMTIQGYTRLYSYVN